MFPDFSALQTASTSPPSPKKLNVQPSEHLTQWLQETNLSIGFTTYQTNRLFLLGHQANGRLALNERLFDKPMGLFVDGQRLLMSTRYQIWELENRLAAGESYQGCDRLYVPAQSHTTGDINVHDLVLDAQQRLVFVNTDFSCLATLRPGYSFEPIWQPSFITKLAAEDRCHLNGLALRNGEPTYVTACSTTDESSGWRNHQIDGGVVIHVPSNELITTGLSMPHSPRWYQGKLWLLNSGTGELGYLDNNQFQPVIFCPGFVRGLAFWQNFAVVGLSKLRSRSFSGLPLATRLADQGLTPQCGLMVIDLNTGQMVHWLHIDGVVEELFDIVLLRQVSRPRSLGFQDDDIERLVTFPGSDGLIMTKPTVNRPSLSPVQSPGLPRPERRTNQGLKNEERGTKNEEIKAQLPNSLNRVWGKHGGIAPTVWGKHGGIAPTPQLPNSPTPPRLHSELRTQNSELRTQNSPTPQLPTPPTENPKYQQVFQLDSDNAHPYEHLTFPSLQQRWRTQPQQGDLVAIAASIAGELVGMAIAEQRPDQTAEIISLFVAPTVRQQGIGTRLLYHLQKRLKSCTQIQITYPVSPLTAAALEPMLRKLQWSTPTTSTVLAAGTDHPATPTQPETRFSLFSHGPRSP